MVRKNLGINVPEIKVDEIGNIIILNRPTWIKEVLDEVMFKQIVKKDSQKTDKQLVKKINYYDPNLEFFKKCTERK